MTPPQILIIDDEDDIREVAQMGLELVSGWRVETADSGPEGASRAAADVPDAILLDVMMPDVDGPATLKLLRSDPATASIPVVFLTARAQASDVDWLTGLGADGVLAKPFDPVTLADDVARVLGWSERS